MDQAEILEIPTEQTTLLEALKEKIIQRPSTDSHKGSGGRVGVFGGSSVYCGAPYFSSISALKTGVDLVHVFCHSSASQVIKSYSPDLIVHSIDDEAEGFLARVFLESSWIGARLRVFQRNLLPWFERLHVYVFGPGISDNQLLLQSLFYTFEKSLQYQPAYIFDADAFRLWAFNKDFSLKNSPYTVLTPNKAELLRLFSYFNIQHEQKDPGSPESCQALKEPLLKLARRLGSRVGVIAKGRVDLICISGRVVECSESSGLKRCGGQGDILNGILACFLFSARQNSKASDYVQSMLAAMYGSCYLLRKASHGAYVKHHRAVCAKDIIREIGPCFKLYFDSD